MLGTTSLTLPVHIGIGQNGDVWLCNNKLHIRNGSDAGPGDRRGLQNGGHDTNRGSNSYGLLLLRNQLTST